MRKKVQLSLLGGLVLAACAQDPSARDQVGRQGMYLRSDIPASADVVGVRFDFTPVDCADGAVLGASTSVERPLEPFKIPGGIGDLENNPLDADSEHFFADAFATLEPGCYDVVSTPITESGEPSATCRPARERLVEVFEGRTTEIFLVNQCSGEDPGALDVIATLNHEPNIDDVEFEHSKFRACGETQVICATVTDPDKDPLEFEWTLDESSPAAAGPRVVRRDEDPETGTVTECVEYEPSAPGKYNVTLRVYDRVWKDGEPIRIEEWLAEAGYPSESHAQLDFFFYVSRTGAAAGGGTTIGAHALASTAADLLVLGSSVTGGESSAEALVAASLGYTVDVVDDATWSSLTAADFAAYKALIIGDPRCESGTADPTTGAVPRLAAAEANADEWAAAVTGNVIVIGGDPSYHFWSVPADKATKLMTTSIAFAAAEPTKTGAYVTLSCYYQAVSPSAPAPVRVLSGFGHFESSGPGATMDTGIIVASHPAMDGLTNEDVSNWVNTVHEVFTSWPSNFQVLAISPEGSAYTAGDGSVGTPFIVARGVTSVGCGNGTLDPGEACDDGNNESGDGCDRFCRSEVCGDGVVQDNEECDDGNTEDGDGCSRLCVVEACR